PCRRAPGGRRADRRPARPRRAMPPCHRALRAHLRRRGAAPCQHALHRDAARSRRDAGDGARPRRRDGERRRGLLVGQIAAQPRARGDGRRARGGRLRHPRQPRLEHDRGRYRPSRGGLGRAPSAHPGECRMSERNRPPIYLDYQATTPCDPRVLAEMLPWFTEKFGNPGSITHAYGREAEAAVERAGAQVAALIGAEPREIVFTSGATESNNLAVKGAAHFHRSFGKDHIVTLATEHKCVLESCAALEREGIRVTYLPVGPGGLVDLAELAAALDERTVLVSVMAAHNEIGVVQPLAEIAALCRARGALFHSDGAQAVGKLPLDVAKSGIDLLSISGHKLYGPKGIGALYVRRRPRARIAPLIDGGGQERGLRSGTLPTPL